MMTMTMTQLTNDSDMGLSTTPFVPMNLADIVTYLRQDPRHAVVLDLDPADPEKRVAVWHRGEEPQHTNEWWYQPLPLEDPNDADLVEGPDFLHQILNEFA